MEKEYYKSLYGENPADYNGNNPSCLLCDKEAEHLDEYCEDHQRCYYCGERETCEDEGKNCKEEINEAIDEELKGRKELDIQDINKGKAENLKE